MTTTVGPQNRILTGEREADLASQVLSRLDGPLGQLHVAHTGEDTTPLPVELGKLLQQVLQAVATGSSISVTAIPREVTTSTAAAMLGVSRPTVMKLIRDGALPAHRVGTHTRLTSDDVLAYKRARRERERAAFAALLEAEGDED